MNEWREWNNCSICTAQCTTKIKGCVGCTVKVKILQGKRKKVAWGGSGRGMYGQDAFFLANFSACVTAGTCLCL